MTKLHAELTHQEMTFNYWLAKYNYWCLRGVNDFSHMTDEAEIHMSVALRQYQELIEKLTPRYAGKNEA